MRVLFKEVPGLEQEMSSAKGGDPPLARLRPGVPAAHWASWRDAFMIHQRFAVAELVVEVVKKNVLEPMDWANSKMLGTRRFLVEAQLGGALGDAGRPGELATRLAVLDLFRFCHFLPECHATTQNSHSSSFFQVTLRTQRWSSFNVCHNRCRTHCAK